MILEEILDILKSTVPVNTYLYFITRVIKPETKKSSKILDKYDFKLYQIDVNNDIREHLYNIALDQLDHLLFKKSEVTEYDVITDDTEQLFTYDMKNKAMSFADVINNQLKSRIPKISRLDDLIKQEELWAYCVGFYSIEKEWIYTFRKILSSKVSVSEENSNSISGLAKYIRTHFNSKSNKLELIEGETINLDKQIDCIYYKDMFYIAKKTQFEQIVGLDAEFKEQSKDVVCELEKVNMIEGLDKVLEEIESTPSIHKKLLRLYKAGTYKDLNKDSLYRMQSVAKSLDLNLKISNDGKILLENKEDIETALKLLAEFYKEGKVFGRIYGTYAGKQISLN